MQLHARRDVYDYGLLPLHSLCPQLDSLSTLQRLHSEFLARSTSSLRTGESEGVLVKHGWQGRAVLPGSCTRMHVHA